MDSNEGYLQFNKHTKSKLGLLKYYVPLWEKIVGGNDKIPHYIIDCTAGTGINEIEGEKCPGSALISCKELKKRSNLEVILIEKEKKYELLLELSVKDYFYKSPDLIKKIHFYKVDCYNIADSILNQIEGTISLFIMDPFGPVYMNLIEKIGTRTLKPLPFKLGTEIFIYFDVDYIIWFGPAAQRKEVMNKADLSDSEKKAKRKIEDINKVYGDDSWQEIFKRRTSNDEKRHLLLKLYIEKLKRLFRFVIPLKVTGINKKFHYYFIFVTNFYEAFNSVYSKVNKIESEGTLFQIDAFGKKQFSKEELKKIIQKKLSENKIQLNSDEQEVLFYILNYKIDYETDIYDENLKRHIKKNLKKYNKNTETVIQETDNKIVKTEIHDENLKKHLMKHIKEKVNRIPEILDKLTKKSVFMIKEYVNGLNITFNRYYLNPELLKESKSELPKSPKIAQTKLEEFIE